jgi:L-malate glycosyltransferase
MNKILIYISANVNQDGAERSLVALSRHLNIHTNIDAIVIIPKNGPIVKLLEKNDINYIIHPFFGIVNTGRGVKYLRGMVKFTFNLLSSFTLYLKLYFKKTMPVIVHTNTLTTDFGYLLSRRMNCPHVWHIREFAKLAFDFDFELGLPYVKHCIKNSSKVICISESVKEYYSTLFKNNDLVRVYNGIDISQIHVTKYRTSGTFRMLLIGRLSPEKSQKHAILACSELLKSGRNNFVLDIWGEGSDYENLVNLIKSLNLEKYIKMKGYGNSIPIHEYDLGLNCTIYEAFGRVTVEYMLSGIPVVGSDSGGTKEIISKDTGALYRKDNFISCFEALSLFYDDRLLCKRMGLAGRLRATSLFSEQSYFSNIIAQYEKINSEK